MIIAGSIFFIWILFGIGAVLAVSRKGRSSCGWFALGFLLGPFGLLFALLVPALPQDSPSAPEIAGPAPSPAAEISLDQETKSCPHCAETIKLLARKCRFCGESLDPAEVERLVAQRRAVLEDHLAKLQAGLKQCPRCHKWDVHRAYIEDGSQGDWCPHCQMSLQRMARLAS